MIPETILPLLFLTIGSIEDLRTREIRLALLIPTCIAGIALLLLRPARSPMMLLTSLLPGILLFFISLATRGGIGEGDALTVLALGFFYRFEGVLMILLAALFLASLFSGILFLRKGRRNRAFPFLPFLLLSLILYLILCKGDPL